MLNFCAVILINCSCLSQNIRLFIQSERYTNEVSSLGEKYFFFGKYYIDRSNQGIINLSTLEAGINTRIPNKKSSDLIVLDIENKVYQDVKTKSSSDPNYQSNITKLVGMIQRVKKLRPNARVVLYGMPFNFNYDFQKHYNDFEKLKPLLRVVDYLTPALYLMYSNLEKGDDYFKKYINSNLNLTFQFAEKVNKPVLPFVWYKIHTYNKISGGSEISSCLYSNYLKLIKDYKYKNKKVDGIIYWESANQTLNINKKLDTTLKILK